MKTKQWFFPKSQSQYMRWQESPDLDSNIHILLSENFSNIGSIYKQLRETLFLNISVFKSFLSNVLQI